MFFVYCFIKFFFCKWKLLFRLGESQLFKDEPYSCQLIPIFSIFQRFFKVEGAFPYSGNVFFNIFHPASARRFSAYWKQYFLVSAIALLLETIIGIRRKQFWEKELIVASGQLIFWLVEIIFFSIFWRLLSVIVYLPSSGSVFFNVILHFEQWKRIFWLVETVFFCLEVFPSSGNRHLNWWKPVFKERLYFN